jgi:hypothetical protein
MHQTGATGAGVSKAAIDRRAQRRIGDLTARAGAAVGQPGALERFEGRRVGFGTPALPEHRAIPLEAKGLKCFQDIVRGTRDIARRIDILHTHQPLAALAAGIEKTADRRDQRPEMQGPGGRRRETPAIGNGLVRHHDQRNQTASLGEILTSDNRSAHGPFDLPGPPFPAPHCRRPPRRRRLQRNRKDHAPE